MTYILLRCIFFCFRGVFGFVFAFAFPMLLTANCLSFHLRLLPFFHFLGGILILLLAPFCITAASFRLLLTAMTQEEARGLDALSSTVLVDLGVLADRKLIFPAVRARRRVVGQSYARTHGLLATLTLPRVRAYSTASGWLLPCRYRSI